MKMKIENKPNDGYIYRFMNPYITQWL